MKPTSGAKRLGPLALGLSKNDFDCCAASRFSTASPEWVKSRLSLVEPHVCFRQFRTSGNLDHWQRRANTGLMQRSKAAEPDNTEREPAKATYAPP
jgi:hypothetical protein